MAFINARKAQAARAEKKRATIKRLLAKIGAEVGQRPGEDVGVAFRRAMETRATARAAWTAVERAEERARLERRIGCLARLRCGAVAVCRRPDALPLGAERLDVPEARAALATGPRLRLVGHHGSHLDVPPVTFDRLAAPLMEAA